MAIDGKRLATVKYDRQAEGLLWKNISVNIRNKIFINAGKSPKVYSYVSI
jgi:hypothetical protein